MAKGSEMRFLSKPMNPYLLALFTAILAGAISAMTAHIQAHLALEQKLLEFRVQAYSSFLRKVDRGKSPVLAKFLAIGTLSESVATDSEIQALEDDLASLLKSTNVNDLYLQFNNDVANLRLHGSPTVHRYCDDILKLLSLRDPVMDWKQYPDEIQRFSKHWREIQDTGIAYGWEEQVSSDERLMFIVVSRLYRGLLDELHATMHAPR